VAVCPQSAPEHIVTQAAFELETTNSRQQQDELVRNRWINSARYACVWYLKVTVPLQFFLIQLQKSKYLKQICSACGKFLLS
jgi:hypothetical protein